MRATLFRNGTLFDGHRYVGRADVLVRDARVVPGRALGFRDTRWREFLNHRGE